MKPFFAFAALLLAGCGRPEPSAITVEDGWARATVAGQNSAAAYLTIINRGGGDDRLIEVAVPRAGQAMLHSSTMDSGVMRMRHLADGLAIPANATVELAPNGTHIMLTGLTAPLRPNELLPATLDFSRAGPKQVTILVKQADAQ